MPKYLVTGCAGFIGAQTARQLLDKGHEVVGIDNLNDYYDVRLKKHRLENLQRHPGFEFEPSDLENAPAIRDLLARHSFAAVLNLAARAGVRYSVENPQAYVATNTLGALNLMNEMQRSGIPKLVLASTSSLYAGQTPPFTEDLPVNHPISPYAASKKAAEVMAYTYHHLFGLDVSVVRYFTVYGPAGRPDMSPFRFIKWVAEGTPITLFGDGRQTRDFTFVDDIAAGTLAALRPLGYEIINLGGGRRPYSILELIGLIEEQLQKKAVIEFRPFQKADMQDTAANIEKARRLLDWTPATDLPEGIAKCVDWYRANASWLGDIQLGP